MSERTDRLYCQDILESGVAIRSYVEGIDFAAFVRDRMRYSAVIRELTDWAMKHRDSLGLKYASELIRRQDQ